MDGPALTVLCRLANEALNRFYRAGLSRPDVVVGVMTSIQLFGDAVNPHVHLHVIATDGAFDSEGFHRLPVGPEDASALERVFASLLLNHLVAKGKISPLLKEKMLSWRRSGFSVDMSVRVADHDAAGLARLLRYVARPPISNERLAYDAQAGVVTVASAKRVAGTRKVVARYDPLEFLALLSLQVPPTGCHSRRYFGYYSTRQRAARRRSKEALQTTGGPVAPEMPSPDPRSLSVPPSIKARRRSWAQLMRLVLEVDPLVCPSCGGPMRFIAFITMAQSAVIDRILTHLRFDRVPTPPSRPPPWLQARMAQEYLDENPDVLPLEDTSRSIRSGDAYILDVESPD